MPRGHTHLPIFPGIRAKKEKTERSELFFLCIWLTFIPYLSVLCILSLKCLDYRDKSCPLICGCPRRKRRGRPASVANGLAKNLHKLRCMLPSQLLGPFKDVDMETFPGEGDRFFSRVTAKRQSCSLSPHHAHLGALVPSTSTHYLDVDLRELNLDLTAFEVPTWGHVGCFCSVGYTTLSTLPGMRGSGQGKGRTS